MHVEISDRLHHFRTWDRSHCAIIPSIRTWHRCDNSIAAWEIGQTLDNLRLLVRCVLDAISLVDNMWYSVLLMHFLSWENQNKAEGPLRSHIAYRISTRFVSCGKLSRQKNNNDFSAGFSLAAAAFSITLAHLVGRFAVRSTQTCPSSYFLRRCDSPAECFSNLIFLVCSSHHIGSYLLCPREKKKTNVGSLCDVNCSTVLTWKFVYFESTVEFGEIHSTSEKVCRSPGCSMLILVLSFFPGSSLSTPE